MGFEVPFPHGPGFRGLTLWGASFSAQRAQEEGTEKPPCAMVLTPSFARVHTESGRPSDFSPVGSSFRDIHQGTGAGKDTEDGGGRAAGSREEKGGGSAAQVPGEPVNAAWSCCPDRS